LGKKRESPGGSRATGAVARRFLKTLEAGLKRTLGKNTGDGVGLFSVQSGGGRGERGERPSGLIPEGLMGQNAVYRACDRKRGGREPKGLIREPKEGCRHRKQTCEQKRAGPGKERRPLNSGNFSEETAKFNEEISSQTKPGVRVRSTRKEKFEGARTTSPRSLSPQGNNQRALLPQKLRREIAKRARGNFHFRFHVCIA